LRGLLLRRFRLGSMMPNDASGCRAGDGMMSCNVTGDGTHGRPFHTTFCRRHLGP
jgi:hypothetical protein